MITSSSTPFTATLDLSSVSLGQRSSVVAAKIAERRRRRVLLETLYAPVVSTAALPSTVDRIVLWRSHHGRHGL